MPWSPGSSPAQPAGPPGQCGSHPAEGRPGHHLGCDVGTCSCAGHGREDAGPHSSQSGLHQREGHVPVRRPEGRDGQRGGHCRAVRTGEFRPHADPTRPSASFPLLGDLPLTLSVPKTFPHTGALTGAFPSPRNADTCCPGLVPLSHPSSPSVWGSPVAQPSPLGSHLQDLGGLQASPWAGAGGRLPEVLGGGLCSRDSSCPHLNSVTYRQQEKPKGHQYQPFGSPWAPSWSKLQALGGLVRAGASLRAVWVGGVGHSVSHSHQEVCQGCWSPACLPWAQNRPRWGLPNRGNV